MMRKFEYICHLKTGKKRNIGETKVLLNGDRASVRRYETNLGNLVTDAIVNSFSDFEHTDLTGKVEMAMMSSGDIRASIPIGKVSCY